MNYRWHKSYQQRKEDTLDRKIFDRGVIIGAVGVALLYGICYFIEMKNHPSPSRDNSFTNRLERITHGN